MTSSSIARPINTKKVTSRRKLRFESLDEILAEADRLASMPIRLLGNWSYGQILEHLAAAIDSYYDGIPVRNGIPVKPSWFMRRFVFPFIKNSLLTRGMPSGIQLPKSAEALIPDKTDVQPALEHLRRAINRLKEESPRKPSPFFGDMAPQEWVALTLRHAELHLSFVAID